MSAQQFRAEFDARVEFSNGGHLEVAGFRVDVPTADVSAADVATLFVASLGLLMSEHVELSALRVFPEAHKGTRGGPSAVPDTSSDRPRRLIDLSHVTEPGMPTTCLDTPFRDTHEHDLSTLPLRRIADLPAVVVRTTGAATRAVDVGALAPFDVAGKAVLLHTDADHHFGTPAYAEDAPYLTAAGAQWLADHAAAVVGIDAIGLDHADDPARPARTILLGADIPIVEHLTGLGRLPPHGARFTAAPLRLAHTGTAPVRAFAAV
ncbi:cyclase family protein [Cryptosporangium minutisporangium]|uniref:Cyclase family protein n=1 Tax=Cryptosporangium minutisporangium TaxID=113569 RepID=A0ABP6T9M1_9ACTN